MKKQGLIVLFVILSFIYILNSLTPLLADDYFAAFIWPEGVRINGLVPENAKRITGLANIYESVKNYFLTWGGRVPGSVFRQFFVWQGKAFFNLVNAFMLTTLVAEVYWLSHEGKVTFSFNPTYLVWIFFSLWAFNVRFIDTCLWVAGSCDYLWMTVLILAFLMPYVRNYFDASVFKHNITVVAVMLFFLGLIVGCSNETTNCWIVIVLAYWLYVSRKKDDLQAWQLFGFIGFCLGYALLILAPGNYSRLQLQQHTGSLVMSNALLGNKLVELVIILFFHLILWYFIISFFFKFRNRKHLFVCRETDLYLNTAKLFILIACGSGLIMFFIPSNGLRTSFLNLVYLTVASAFLFRLLEKSGISFFDKASKSFLSIIGCAYLIITMSVSLWGNYINNKYWNDIVINLDKAKVSSANIVIEILPPPTSQNDKWLLGSGLHLVPIPVVHDESHEFNKMISIYYGIKGIKLKE